MIRTGGLGHNFPEFTCSSAVPQILIGTSRTWPCLSGSWDWSASTRFRLTTEGEPRKHRTGRVIQSCQEVLAGAHWLLLPGGPTHRAEGDQLAALWPANLSLTPVVKGLFQWWAKIGLVTLRGGNKVGKVSKYKTSNDSMLYLYPRFYISIFYSSLFFYKHYSVFHYIIIEIQVLHICIVIVTCLLSKMALNFLVFLYVNILHVCLSYVYTWKNYPLE